MRKVAKSGAVLYAETGPCPDQSTLFYNLDDNGGAGVATAAVGRAS